MPEYLTPGVYVEEFDSGPRPIEGVSTSTAGMVGATERGPLRPQLVTSWSDYQHWFGGAVSGAFLPVAVQGFFENGGQRLFVAPVVGAGSATATIALPTGAAPLELAAIGPGSWGNHLTARVGPGSQPDCIRLTILHRADVVEDYDNLTIEPGSPSNLVAIVNTHSRLVTVAAGPALRPIDGESVASGGSDVTPDTADFVNGLAALEDIDEISLLLVPDEVRDGTGAITGAVISQCERLKDRFAIVSAPGHLADVSSIRPPRDTAYAAFYYPWIRIVSAGSKDSVLMPASGHVAGIYARTDLERGVHKAPANEVVRGLDCDGTHDPLEFFISKSEQEVLNPRGVNVIRDFRSEGRGVRVWGARTMSSDPEWKYISVRRFFIFVEESIDEGTQWVVFEPNSEATWSIVRRTVTDFLRRLWRNGALVGVTEDDAFFVKCDRTTMTQDDIDNGRLICLIGMAPLRPAEFVIFRIGQKTAGSSDFDP